MELNIYNESLVFIGVLDDFFSLRWRRKYATCGEFELHCNVNTQTLKLLQSGYILSKKGSVEAGVIEDITIQDNEENGETITVKGRFLSSYLDRRLTGATVIVKDTSQNAMRKYVNESCINPTDTDRIIPFMKLGGIISDTGQIEIQATYKSVLATCERLARKSAKGFRIRPDFSTKQLYFEVYEGIDKSINQSVRSCVILSDEYDNTKNTSYNYSNTAYKTHCLVCGSDENNLPKYANVGGGVGLSRRETYINASESKTAEIADADYQKILAQNGNDALKQAEIIENFETEVDILEDYKTAWDLGDIVSCIKKGWRRTLDARVTEVEEVYENGIVQIMPTLGNPIPELIDLLKEE